MRKVVVLILFLLLWSGCAGLGFYKKATLMPDEISISGSTNPEGDSRRIGFGFKWELK